MGAAITPDNEIFIAGGRRGDGQGDQWLNDVWSLDTKHETYCAASLAEPAPCSRSTCQLGANGKSTLGNRTSQHVIWRAPSAGGKACQAPDGSPRSQLGAV